MARKAPQQKTTIKSSRLKKYTPRERKAIGEEIVRFIISRTRDDNRDKDGRRFKGYSKTYKESLDFKIAGKSASDVDLTLSGEMLDSLEVLTDRSGEITIGYEKGDDKLNGKVEGNRKGTYGQKRQVGPKRDHLGISQKSLNKILAKYPVRNDTERLARVIIVEEAQAAGQEVVSGTELGEENEDS